MTNFSPIARILLRYFVGGLIMGSSSIGERLAADPDLVVLVAAVVGVAVETTYALAKRHGWRT